MGKMGWLVVVVSYVHAEMEQRTERENHHGVDHPEGLAVMVDEEPWHQPAVVGIEHYHLEQRADAAYSIAHPVDAILMTDKMEGGEEQHAPRGDMDEDIDVLIHNGGPQWGLTEPPSWQGTSRRTLL